MADNKFNRRRATYLLTIICAVGAIIGSLWAYRAHHIRAGFLAMGRDGLKAAQAGDLPRAVDLLGQYLARYPNDNVEILRAYAHARPLVVMPNDEQDGQTIWALRLLLQMDLSSLDPAARLEVRREARRQLMAIYARTGFYAEALDAANIVLRERIGDPQNPPATAVATLRNHPDAMEAIAARTHSLLRLRTYREALDACNLWIEAAPDDIEPALVRVELLQDNHKSQQEAQELADTWGKNHSSSTANSWATDNDLLLAHTDLLYGLIRDTNPTTQPGSSSDPASTKNTAPVPTTGPALTNERPPLYTLLEHAATSNPHSRLAVRVLIADLDAVGRTELARQVVGRMVRGNPGDKTARYELIRRDWDSGHLDEVIEISSVLPPASAPTFVLALKASAMMMLGKQAELKQSMQSLRDRTSDSEAVAWVAVMQQSLDGRGDNVQRILTVCHSALDQNPRDYYLRHFMAEADVQLGERETAIQEWQRVVADDPNWALPAMRLSTIELEAGRPEQALQTAAMTFSRAPFLAVGLVRAEAWTACVQAGHFENSDQCLIFLDALAIDLPKEGRLKVLKAIVLAATGQTQLATDIVHRALSANDPLPEQCWIQFASLCQTKSMLDSNLARECLARSQRENGITPAIAFAKAVSLNDAKAGLVSFDADAAAATHFQGSASQLSPLTRPANVPAPDQSKPMSWGLARATYLEINHDPAALNAWQRLVSDNADNLRVQQVALSVPNIRAKSDLSAQCIQNIKKLNGEDSETYKLAHARYLVSFEEFFDKSGQQKPVAIEARNSLDELVRKQPNSIEIRLLSAQAFELLKRPHDAIQELRAAQNLNPKALFIRLALVHLLESVGDFAGVGELVDQLTAADLSGLEQASQRNDAAAMLAQQGKIDRAIKLLEEGENADRDANTASLLLVRLYLRHGDQEKAEKTLKDLLSKHPDAATLAFGAEMLASQKRMDEALQLLNEIDKDPSVRPGVVDRIRAEFAFQSDSAASPDKTVHLLEQAIQKAKADPLNWHALAAVYLLSNQPQKALDTAKSGLVSIPDDPTLKAIAVHPEMPAYAVSKQDLRPFLMSFMNDSFASSAAESLVTIYQAAKSQQPLVGLADELRQEANKNPRFTPVHAYLARLYEQLQRPDDAIIVATDAVKATPDSSQAHEAIIEALMAAGDWREVLTAANDWETSIPADKPMATVAAAEAMMRLGRAGEAVKLLQPLVDAPKSKADYDVLSKAYEDVLREYFLAARLAGITPDLDSLLQPLQAKGAAGRIQWMRFSVTNMKTPAEAEAFLRQAGSTMPPSTSRETVLEHLALSEMYAQLAAQGNEPRYKQIARDILQELLQAKKPESEVLMSMAVMLDNDGNWSAAIPYYQQVLAAAPNSSLIQNNLAMDLARTGHAAEAIPLLDAAIKAVPESPELFDSRAFVLSQAGLPDRALTDIHAALRLAPLEPRFHLRLVQILCDAKRTKDAAAALKHMENLTFAPSALSTKQTQQLNDLRKRLSGVAAAGR